MRFDDFFRSLSEVERNEYAVRAGTTAEYLRIFVAAPLKRRKIPRPKLIDALVFASDGAITKSAMLDYLYETELPNSLSA